MKDFKLYIGLASLMLIGYLVAEYNKPKSTNWMSTLYYNDKIPYGTYVFYHQLNHLFPDAEVIKTNKSLSTVFQDSSIQSGNYFIVSHTLSISKPDVEAMLKFISNGNHVFISTFDWSGPLADTLQLQARSSSQKAAVFHMVNSKLKRAAQYSFKHDIGNQYFSSFDTAHAVSLSQNQQGKTTYLRFDFGKGSLYVFANPHLLSNYSLLKPQGASYTAKLLSCMPLTNAVYWDEYQNHDIAEDISPMRVFFSYESLRWAYYISLASLLLFVLFEVKRRQRVIPVIEPVANSTLEFVNIVGRVYYEQRNNKNIALKKITYLADYLRTRYRLKADFNDRNFVNVLAHKSGITSLIVDELFTHIRYINVQTQINDHELIILNQLIEKFYAQA